MSEINRLLTEVRTNAQFMGAGKRRDAIFNALDELERHLAAGIATEDEIEQRIERAVGRAVDYASYGGSMRHPLDMD